MQGGVALESIIFKLDDILDTAIRNKNGHLVSVLNSSINKHTSLSLARNDSEQVYENNSESQVLGTDYYEGTLKRVYLNKYERNPKLRRECIRYHGYYCKICNFNFEERYGEVGKDRIHVHHIIQLSQIGKKHKVDPVKDMITVCPNCHFVIHSRKEPYTIDEMKKMIKGKK